MRIQTRGLLTVFMDRSLALGDGILKGWPSLSPGLDQSIAAGLASTLSGLGVVTEFIQGRRWCANPGLYDCNPVGVAAENWHPVGVAADNRPPRWGCCTAARNAVENSGAVASFIKCEMPGGFVHEN